MKKKLKLIDLNISKYISLKYSHYVKYDPLLGGTGQYTKEEWEKHRKIINVYKDVKDNDLAFLNKIIFDEYNKLEAVHELIKIFDFYKIVNLLEIGSGYMYQTFLLNLRYPHLNITATDFDSNVIEQSINVKLLSNINKMELDILNDGISNKYDLAMSWAVDYHFTDDEFIYILKKLSAKNTNYLVLSLTVATPVRYFKNLIFNNSLQKKVKDKQVRAHGWERSLKYFNNMAIESNFNFKYIGNCNGYKALWFYK